MTPGSLASGSVYWLKRLGAVGRGSALEESPLSRHVNLFTTLRTISSNGAAVKAPPCMHRPRRSGQGH